MTEKVACLECGQPVSKSLASRREGLCLGCSAKRNPFFVLYRKQNPEREFNSGHRSVEVREYGRRGSNSLAGLS